MPIYNADAFVSESIESVLFQTRSDFELILVDDGSTDRTLEIIQRYAHLDRRVRVISRPNTGVVGAFNDGIAIATGEFLAIMHADDIAFPERFARQVDYLNRHPNCVAVGSAILRVDTDGSPIHAERWTCDAAEIREELLKGRGGLAHPTAMVRTVCLRSVGGYRRQFELVEDKDLWLRLDDVGELANLPEVLLAYRRHDQTLSRQHINKVRGLLIDVVADARRRRGVSGPVPFRLKSKQSLTNQSELARWVRGAASNGSIGTASHYMKRLIVEYPADIRTWSTAARFVDRIRKHAVGKICASPSTRESTERLRDALDRYRVAQQEIAKRMN